MRSIISTFIVGSALLLGACGPKSETPVSQSKALVSEEQAEEAFKIVKAIDYIPFTYIVDGCYARSLYMSMELAAQGIPSSAHYIYGNLQPTEGVSWWYHVAPLIVTGPEEEPWILDPAFQSEPLRRSQWIAKNDPAARYTTELKAGSAYFDESGRTSEFNNDRMIQNFEEMPTFLTSDISSACTVMFNYLRNTAKTSAELSTLRETLVSRTFTLVEALKANGKLEADGYNWEANRQCRAAVGL